MNRLCICLVLGIALLNVTSGRNVREKRQSNGFEEDLDDRYGVDRPGRLPNRPNIPNRPLRNGQNLSPGQNGQNQFPWQNGQNQFPWQNGQNQFPWQNSQNQFSGQNSQNQFSGQNDQNQFPLQNGQNQFTLQNGQNQIPWQNSQNQFTGQNSQNQFPWQNGQNQFPGQNGQNQFPGQNGQNQFPGQNGQNQFPGQNGQNQFPGQNGQNQFPGQNGQNQFPKPNGQNQLSGQNGQSPAQMWQTTESNSVQECIRRCPVSAEYNPVCGTNSITYMNPAQLTCAQTCGVAVNLLRASPCPVTPFFYVPVLRGQTTESNSVQECIRRCPVSAEYNPVCGTNSITYMNPAQLTCAQTCGVAVNLLRASPCPVTPFSYVPVLRGQTTESNSVQECIRRCPVPAEYNPVCGTNSITYMNPAQLTCAQTCGVAVNLLRASPCPLTTTAAPSV